jgi:hypothetical protein
MTLQMQHREAECAAIVFEITNQFFFPVRSAPRSVKNGENAADRTA